MTFLDFYRAQRTTLPVLFSPQVTSSTYIITGANTGLGFECAQHLVRARAARVILACRSLAKGEAAKEQIERATGHRGIAQVWQLDLASTASIKTFAERVGTLDRVDALLENAGVAAGQWELAEGREMNVAVNVVGTFLLATLVLPKLVESAKKFGTTPCVAVVGSGAAFHVPGELEKVQEDMLQGLNKQETFNAERYPVSKLLELYFVREWATRYPFAETGVVINYTNPGLCSTDLNQSAPFIQRHQINLMRLVMGRTPEEGSRTLLAALSVGKESHGKYLSECVVKEGDVPEWVTNESGRDIQNRTWDSVVKVVREIAPGFL